MYPKDSVAPTTYGPIGKRLSRFQILFNQNTAFYGLSLQLSQVVGWYNQFVVECLIGS